MTTRVLSSSYATRPLLRSLVVPVEPNEPQLVLRRLKTLIFIVFLGGTNVFADVWKTTDGNISVATPDASQFVEVGSTPPLSVIWVSKDETIKLGVAEIPFRRGTKLVRSAVERGFAKETGGKIVASSAKQQAGHDVFDMTCHWEMSGNDVYTTQLVVAVGDKVYKVMATGIGKDTRVDPDAAAFVASLEILTPKQVVNSDPPESVRSSQPELNDSRESLVDRLSQRIGAISALILIVSVIAIVLLRFAKRRKSIGDHSI
jgi:hypothetical protein